MSILDGIEAEQLRKRYDPALHPRWPAGAANGKGGEFMRAGDMIRIRDLPDVRPELRGKQGNIRAILEPAAVGSAPRLRVRVDGLPDRVHVRPEHVEPVTAPDVRARRERLKALQRERDALAERLRAEGHDDAARAVARIDADDPAAFENDLKNAREAFLKPLIEPPADPLPAPGTPQRINVKWLDKERRQQLSDRLGYLAAQDPAIAQQRYRPAIKRELRTFVLREIEARVGQERAERWATAQFLAQVYRDFEKHKAAGVRPGGPGHPVGQGRAYNPALDQLEEIFARNNIGNVRRLGGGINISLKGKLEGDGEIVIKPGRGAYVYPDIPQTDDAQERAAWLVMKRIAEVSPGRELPMPPVVKRTAPDNLLGAIRKGDKIHVNKFQPGVKALAYGMYRPTPAESERAGFFDALIENHDRHLNNAGEANGRLFLYDHGLTFPVENTSPSHRAPWQKPRATKPEEDKVLADIVHNWDTWNAMLKDDAGLNDRQIAAFKRRVHYMYATGNIPSRIKLQEGDVDSIGQQFDRAKRDGDLRTAGKIPAPQLDRADVAEAAAANLADRLQPAAQPAAGTLRGRQIAELKQIIAEALPAEHANVQYRRRAGGGVNVYLGGLTDADRSHVLGVLTRKRYRWSARPERRYVVFKAQDALNDLPEAAA